MIRYIAVSEHSGDLYAFVTADTEDQADAAVIAEAGQWVDHETAPNAINRTYRNRDACEDLAVYSVPDEIEITDEVDASMTHVDGVFGDYRSFYFVGYLVRESEDEAAL